LLTLHLNDFVFKLLVFEHQKFVLGVELGDAVQSAVDFDAKSLCCFIHTFIVVRGRLLGA
jgi:hypothetical protein